MAGLLLFPMACCARAPGALCAGHHRHRLHQWHRRADRAFRSCARCLPAAHRGQAAGGLLPRSRPCGGTHRAGTPGRCCSPRCALPACAWLHLSSKRLPLPDELLRASAVRNVTRIPAPIVARSAFTLLATLWSFQLKRSAPALAASPATCPAPHWPALDWAAAKQLVTPTLTIALLGAVEVSAVRARGRQAMPDLPATTPTRADGPSIANIASPLMGMPPPAPSPAPSPTSAGVRTPLAGMVHALAVLTAMLVAAPLAPACAVGRCWPGCCSLSPSTWAKVA